MTISLAHSAAYEPNGTFEALLKQADERGFLLDGSRLFDGLVNAAPMHHLGFAVRSLLTHRPHAPLRYEDVDCLVSRLLSPSGLDGVPPGPEWGSLLYQLAYSPGLPPRPERLNLWLARLVEVAPVQWVAPVAGSPYPVYDLKMTPSFSALLEVLRRAGAELSSPSSVEGLSCELLLWCRAGASHTRMRALHKCRTSSGLNLFHLLPAMRQEMPDAPNIRAAGWVMGQAAIVWKESIEAPWLLDERTPAGVSGLEAMCEALDIDDVPDASLLEEVHIGERATAARLLKTVRACSEARLLARSLDSPAVPIPRSRM